MQKIQTGTAKIVFVPKELEGYSYGLGNWLKPEDMIVCSPGLSGGWPYIDVKKKYACVIFAQPKNKEDKKDVYVEIIDRLNSEL
jgi:hypothetical protein